MWAVVGGGYLRYRFIGDRSARKTGENQADSPGVRPVCLAEASLDVVAFGQTVLVRSRRATGAIVAQLRAAGCVFAEAEAQLLTEAARSPAELADLVERRVGGLPLEQVVGWAAFCGLRITVTPGVFVPRRRSEFLVEQAANLVRVAQAKRETVLIVDLCCGSGALGAAAVAAVQANHRAAIELHAADIDPAAVRCARENLAAVNGRVYEGDLFEPLPRTLRGRVDVLIANTPYVPTAALPLLPPEARLHEPPIALDGGGDGLDVQRQVAAEARQWLAPGGSLLVEASEEQAVEAERIFAASGLEVRVVRLGGATTEASATIDATVVIATASLS